MPAKVRSYVASLHYSLPWFKEIKRSTIGNDNKHEVKFHQLLYFQMSDTVSSYWTSSVIRMGVEPRLLVWHAGMLATQLPEVGIMAKD